ncbi:MAG: RNA-binding protein [Candidatus Thermoplasmatota archaeon]|nr:RNA-binding protein [Candidatus Thermoplasmatota archaeon]MDI6887672.1 RNA-binding protein [Candidatus Thermoplasmatota archaeon]
MRLKNRHTISKKELKWLSEKLKSIFGKQIISTENVETAYSEDLSMSVFIIENEILAFCWNGEPFLTIKGILKYKPEKRYVTVDAGAIKAISRGADVMAPGIVDLDKEISKGDLVWVRDITYKKPLAVGVALITGEEILSSKKGKAIEVKHRIGNKLWQG